MVHNITSNHGMRHVSISFRIFYFTCNAYCVLTDSQGFQMQNHLVTRNAYVTYSHTTTVCLLHIKVISTYSSRIHIAIKQKCQVFTLVRYLTDISHGSIQRESPYGGIWQHIADYNLSFRIPGNSGFNFFYIQSTPVVTR